MAYTICLNGQPITESAWTLESEAEAAMQRLIATELDSPDSIIKPEALEVLPCKTDPQGFAIPAMSAAEFAAQMWIEQSEELRKANLALHAEAAQKRGHISLEEAESPIPDLLDDSTLAIVAALLVQPHIKHAADWITQELDAGEVQ